MLEDFAEVVGKEMFALLKRLLRERVNAISEVEGDDKWEVRGEEFRSRVRYWAIKELCGLQRGRVSQRRPE